MAETTRYDLADGVAQITLDDGKANVLSPAMLAAVDEGLDRAEADGAGAVVLAGRDGIWSGGFDLATLRGGGEASLGMLFSGFELSFRLLSFGVPVVIACTGHAVAMGSFLLLSGDYRVGADGPFRIVANEVAIGLPMPRAALEICRQRLTPAAFSRAMILAEVHDPAAGLAAGFLDRLAPPDQVVTVARELATGFTQLDRRAHAITKARARAQALTAMRQAIEADRAELEGAGWP